jgi:hypothetical protein
MAADREEALIGLVDRQKEAVGVAQGVVELLGRAPQ